MKYSSVPGHAMLPVALVGKLSFRLLLVSVFHQEGSFSYNQDLGFYSRFLNQGWDHLAVDIQYDGLQNDD